MKGLKAVGLGYTIGKHINIIFVAFKMTFTTL